MSDKADKIVVATALDLYDRKIKAWESKVFTCQLALEHAEKGLKASNLELTGFKLYLKSKGLV